MKQNRNAKIFLSRSKNKLSILYSHLIIIGVFYNIFQLFFGRPEIILFFNISFIVNSKLTFIMFSSFSLSFILN